MANDVSKKSSWKVKTVHAEGKVDFVADQMNRHLKFPVRRVVTIYGGTEQNVSILKT